MEVVYHPYQPMNGDSNHPIFPIWNQIETEEVAKLGVVAVLLVYFHFLSYQKLLVVVVEVVEAVVDNFAEEVVAYTQGLVEEEVELVVVVDNIVEQGTVSVDVVVEVEVDYRIFYTCVPLVLVVEDKVPFRFLVAVLFYEVISSFSLCHTIVWWRGLLFNLLNLRL